MSVFAKKKGKESNIELLNSTDSNGYSDRKKSVQIKSIIETFDLTPVPYGDDDEFRKWKDSFISSKEHELDSMNIDIDCFDVYVSEINAEILKAKNLASNQLFAHISSIRRLIRNIEGKVQRFTDQKVYLEQDLKESEVRLKELKSKKKALEGA